MAHPNKAKGTRAEYAVAKYLASNGHPKAARSRSGWADDRGDIEGVTNLTVEVKDQRRYDLSEWVKELAVEQRNNGTEHGTVVLKKRQSSDVGEWYAIMPMTEFIKLFNKIQKSPPPYNSDLYSD
jgi:hypothetical protein